MNKIELEDILLNSYIKKKDLIKICNNYKLSINGSKYILLNNICKYFTSMNRNDIENQYECYQYINDFFKNNPRLNILDCIKCFDYKKNKIGNCKYEHDDMKILYRDHYEILVNGNIINIYKYSDRFYLNQITGTKNINILHLMTNIEEQIFNKFNKHSDNTIIVIKSKSEIWMKEYNCRWIGGIIRYRPFYEKHSYSILEKKLIKIK